jgi:drug/metabolite transporter (DMT)-like permease
LSTYFLAISGLVFTTFIWGITFELVEESLKSISPAIFSTIRFFIASICTLLLILFKYKKVKIDKNEFKAGIVCGILLSFGYFFQSFGLWENIFYLKSDPNKSAFITGTSVLMVPIIMFLMGKGKPSIHLWFSIILVLSGLAILLNPNVANFTIGDILTFGCAVSFAAHIIFQGQYLISKINNIYNFFFVQMLTTSLLFFIGAIFEIQLSVNNLEWNYTVWSGLWITGVLATFVAILIMVWAQKIISPIQTAMIFTLEPVFAGIYNHFFTEHILSSWGVFSVIIIIIGIVYHEYKANKI